MIFVTTSSLYEIVEKCHSGEPRIGVRGRRRNPVKTIAYWMPGQARHDEINSGI